MPLDLVIRGGWVVDGTGVAPREIDIGIEGDRIADVGRIPSGESDVEEIDARGLLVSPGFIDVHSHSDFTLLRDPRAASSVFQGVTTEVIGNCGFGCAPLSSPRLARMQIYGYADDVALDWKGMSGYFARLEAARPAVNVAALVPNGQIRLSVLGAERRSARPDELERMVGLLDEAFDAGAWGFSTGLEYGPEAVCTEDEIARMCRHVGRRGGLYATHTRNRDEGAVEAVAEAIRTARRADVPLQISHITPRRGRADLDRALALVDEARASGQHVNFDMHTRLFGFTYLNMLLPPELKAAGGGVLRERLKDATARKKMLAFPSLISAIGDWSKVFLTGLRANQQMNGLSADEAQARRGSRSPHEALLDILGEESEDLDAPMVLLRTYDEDLLRHTYQHSVCVPASDATALCPDGPLGSATFHGAYTWAAWFYRRWIRETRTFSLGEGIRRMTGLAAEHMGFQDRGFLKPGMRADLVIFDPAVFGEAGDIEHPNKLALGMRHVLVNGKLAMRNGTQTASRAGRIIRRA